MLARKLSAIALLALTLMTTPAVAQQEEPVRQAVRFGDLDLATSKGLKTLRHRVLAATYLVCGDDRDKMPLEEREIIEQCIQQAKASSEMQIAAFTTKTIQTASIR